MYEIITQQLSPLLSPDASITAEAPSRWSTYSPPSPVATIHVATEADVAATVKYCASANLPFFMQSGGKGWAAFPPTENLVLINLAQLNSVTVSSDKKTITIGGGAKVGETIAAADAAGVLAQVGNCNGIGTLGALLGGGYGNMMGMYGFGVDNVISMRVVTAEGKIVTASANENEGLFWALKGAAPNFGIVTSATLKAYEMPDEVRVAWFGALIFTGDKVEQVVQGVQELVLSDRMVAFMYFASGPAPEHTPMVIVTTWLFQGTPETGREAFKVLFDIGPVADTTSVLPYPQWNTAADPACAHGPRKPAFAAGLDVLDARVWRQVWDDYVDLQKQPGAHGTMVLVEKYPINDMRFVGEASAALPHRKTRFEAIVVPWYEDPGLDVQAVQFGKGMRELWRSSRSDENNATYINFCHGDESSEEVFGDSLPRLLEMKKVWDPENRFNQWFNLC